MKQVYVLQVWWVSVLVMVGLAVNPDAAFSNGFRNPPESATALGMVGGTYALVEDASAMAFNPANLTRLDKPSALVSLNFIGSEVEYTSPLGATATTKDPWKFLPNAFAAWPGESWVVGLAITTPFGQSTEWEQDSVFQFAAPYFAEMKVVNLNPTVAKKITDTLSVAAGVDVFWSELTMRQGFPWSAVTHSMMDQPGIAELNGSGFGVGGNIGLSWQFTPRQCLALSYRSPVRVDYDGDFEVSQIPASFRTLAAPNSNFETEIEFPDVAAAGYGLKVNDALRVGIDVEWIKFSRFDALALDAGVNQGLLPAAVVPEDWDDTWTAGFGAEWTFAADWVMRCGYIFLQSPVPDETLAPTLPDSDQHVVSAGLGYRRGPQAFDLAYAIGLNGDRTVDNNANPAYNGRYEVRDSHMVQAAYSVSF